MECVHHGPMETAALIVAALALGVSTINTLLVMVMLKAVIMPMAPTLKSLYRRAVEEPARIVINQNPSQQGGHDAP